MEAQNITAIASVAIAVLALLATIWQARLTRVHNRKTTTPIFTIHRSQMNGYKIFLRNEGVGPAIITGLTFYVDGIKVDDLKNFDSQLAISIPIEFFRTKVNPPVSVGVSQSFELFILQGDKSFEDKMIEIGTRVGVEVDYKSVYGDSHSTEDNIA